MLTLAVIVSLLLHVPLIRATLQRVEVDRTGVWLFSYRQYGQRSGRRIVAFGRARQLGDPRNLPYVA